MIRSLVIATMLTAASAPALAQDIVRRELTPSEKSEVTRAVAQGLKDPASARFKWTRFVYERGAHVSFYCGLVNAKNSLGGYAGDQAFKVTTLSKNDHLAGAVLLSIFPLDVEHAAMVRPPCDAHELEAAQ